jgi:hypothetical protein
MALFALSRRGSKEEEEKGSAAQMKGRRCEMELLASKIIRSKFYMIPVSEMPKLIGLIPRDSPSRKSGVSE